MEKKEKFKNIEILRIIGAMIIMFRHISWSKAGLFGLYASSIPLYAKLRSNLSGADFWIDFFFIISGFFLFMTTSLETNFKNFFLKKVSRLLPVILFAIAAINILHHFGLAPHKPLYDYYNILLLNGVGFIKPKIWGNLGHTWFVSCLFWASIFLFYLAKSVSKNILNLLMGLFVLFSYTILLTKTTNPVTVYENFISIGLIRAVGGLSIGYFISEWYKDYKENKTSIVMTPFIFLLFSAAEIGLFSFLIGNTVLHKLAFSSWTILIIAFVALFVLMLIRKGFVSKVLNNGLSAFLGKYAYSLFIIHPIVISVFRATLWKNKAFVIANPILTIALTAAVSIVMAVITYHCVERPAAKFLNERWVNKNNN